MKLNSLILYVCTLYNTLLTTVQVVQMLMYTTDSDAEFVCKTDSE